MSTNSPRRSSRLSAKKPAASTSQLRPSRISKSKSQRLRTINPGATRLYLRINRRFLLLFPLPTAAQPNPQPIPPPPGTTGNLNVLIADLLDLHPFAGDTVDWLIRVARLIFEPLGNSSLYTFTTQSLEWWLDREMEPKTWRQVAQGELLRATIYEFRPDNDAFITLSKISERQARSMTTSTSVPQATPFRETLLQRHNACVISGQTLRETLIASHLIPRRLGDDGVQSVFQRFTGSPDVINRYNPLIGVPLVGTLDMLVDIFRLGFWNCGPVSLLTSIRYCVNIFHAGSAEPIHYPQFY